MNTTKRTSPARPTDHTGRTYRSMEEMCRTYGIGSSTYRYRIASGMDIETALTSPVRPLWNSKPATDHTGRDFKSISAMCAAWGIAPDLYCHRLKHGMSVEQALSRPVIRHGWPGRHS